MGSREWRAAAASYKAADQQEVKHDPKDVAEAINELERFMCGSEGAAAKELLAVTKRHVVLGEFPASPGHAVVCLLNGDGLQKSVEGAGLAGVYSSKQQELSRLTSQQALQAFIHPEMGNRKPTDLMPYLMGELDRIAEDVIKR